MPIKLNIFLKNICLNLSVSKEERASLKKFNFFSSVAFFAMDNFSLPAMCAFFCVALLLIFSLSLFYISLTTLTLCNSLPPKKMLYFYYEFLSFIFFYFIHTIICVVDRAVLEQAVYFSVAK
jgi:hypothetical protein